MGHLKGEMKGYLKGVLKGDLMGDLNSWTKTINRQKQKVGQNKCFDSRQNALSTDTTVA